MNRIPPMQIARSLAAATTMLRANFIWNERPDRQAAAMLAMSRWGVSFAGSVAASAARSSRTAAIIDEIGPFPYGDLWDRSNALGHQLAARGVGTGTRVGVLAHNHRGFVESTL